MLVVASAGNTAAAFGRMCSENEIACLIVIAELALNRRTGALVSAGSNGLGGPVVSAPAPWSLRRTGRTAVVNFGKKGVE